ncbi:40S ribosomal protein S3a [Trypanosoma cruzi]|nr:40S ribosomal protein S3a [Trypanosoma cruzi]
MTLGKNKRISKGGKRGKKKAQETMSRKEWYDVVAPKNFEVRQFGKTICNKTQGTKIAADYLRGRVYESNLADLNKTQGDDDAYRKVKFVVQEVQGRNLLTQFHSMEMTSDRVYFCCASGARQSRRQWRRRLRTATPCASS